MTEASWDGECTCQECRILREHRLVVTHGCKRAIRKLTRKDDVADMLKKGTYGCSSDLSKINVSDTDLSGASLCAKNLSWACFDGCTLHGVRFDNCDLTDASFSGACVDKNTTFRLANLKRCNLEIIDAVDGRMDLRYARNLHNTSRLPMGMLPNFFIILDKYRTELRKRKFIKFFIKRSRAEKLIVKLFTLKEDSEDIFLRNATVEIIGCLLFAQKTLIAESRQLGCVGGENYMLKIINEELKKIQDNYFGGTKPRDFFDKCESKYDKSVFGKEKKIMRKLFSKTASCVGNKTICENISILTADWKNKQSSKKGGYLSAIVKFFLRKSKRRSKYKLDLKNRR